ncbi:DUF5684 domain-containing protein [Microbacterium aquimaris]|uniref:DUF5684 domain-containing protein n=1 Tax=Microbacterium aquimaris TaxID=459816 RepID=A0ABU5N4T1_9MICO|nr:DUF5684 domain-containing protein [Microbacterium aquimaris]MDZ8161092.1 DUF5684 domain-containing protein [Microbacterium aquimaris]
MNTDSAATVAVVATSLLVSALLYVWIAIALSAVFRKSGESGWKGWVPVYNVGVLFQLAGYPWWSVLLFLLPVAGPVIVFVVFVLAAHRVGRSFGFGGGMTVLAVVLPPVWATVLGFGSARWIGAEAVGAPRRRTHADAAEPVYSRGFDGTPASFGAEAPGERGRASSGLEGWAPTRAEVPVEPAETPADVADVADEAPSTPAPAPVSPFADWWPDVLDEDPDTDSAVDDPVQGALFDETPVPAGVVTPPSPPHRPDPADLPPSTPATADADEDRVPPPLRRSTARPAWNGFDLSAPGEFTGEVTDAVPGAPAPISAVPVDDARPSQHDAPHDPREVTPAVPDASEEPASPSRDVAGAPDASVTPARSPESVGEVAAQIDAAPPVTRAPAAPRGLGEGPDGDAGAFPDDAGVSAIVGAPVAGSPRSARSSVSARFADVSRDDDLVDQTIVTRRRRTGWVLVGPDGERIALTEDVAVVGRRPRVDAAFPHAQLVTVGDPTRTVSKTHARLELRGDVWTVVDLDSTNGVVLIADNDDETDVHPGAVTRLTPRFLLGDAELRLEEAATS